MGLRQYQQSGLQYNQYNGQYNVPPGQAAGRVKDNFTIRMLMSCSIVVYNNGGMGLMAVIIRKSLRMEMLVVLMTVVVLMMALMLMACMMILMMLM